MRKLLTIISAIALCLAFGDIRSLNAGNTITLVPVPTNITSGQYLQYTGNTYIGNIPSNVNVATANTAAIANAMAATTQCTGGNVPTGIAPNGSAIGCFQPGTVTSVNATNGSSGISVSGGPITSAGILSISLAGNALLWNNLAPGAVTCNNTSIPSIANNGTVNCVPINFPASTSFTSASLICTNNATIDFSGTNSQFYCAGNNGANGNYTITVANTIGANQDTRGYTIHWRQNATGNFTPTLAWSGGTLQPMGTGGTGTPGFSQGANALTDIVFKYDDPQKTLYWGTIQQ